MNVTSRLLTITKSLDRLNNILLSKLPNKVIFSPRTPKDLNNHDVKYVEVEIMLEVLSHDSLYRIHLSTLEILESVGVIFRNKEALKIFEQAGASVDPTKEMVWIPEYLVNEALKKAPSQVVFLARNPRYNLRIGGGRVHYTNGYGADHVIDLETGQRRLATLKDLENFTLISDALENVHYVMDNITPQDVPKETCDRYMALAMLKNTSKHCCLVMNDVNGLRDVIRMAATVVGGEEELRKKPTIINTGLSPTPPLQYPNDTTARLIALARYRIPFELSSGILAGATGPTTLAGSLALANAENIAGLVLTQLVGPGTPILYGSLVSIMDLRYGTPAYGSPECGLINVASCQIAHYYDLPYYATAGVIDSKVPDQQAAHECTLNVLLTALAGGDVIHDAVYGILETGKTACYEQFMIGNEMVSAIDRVLKGITVNDETIALDLIRAVGAGQNYLRNIRAVRHARKYFLREQWQPEIFDRTLRSEWEKKGSKDVLQRSREKVREILRTHRPEPLEKDVEARLQEIVKEAAKSA